MVNFSKRAIIYIYIYTVYNIPFQFLFDFLLKVLCGPGGKRKSGFLVYPCVCGAGIQGEKYLIFFFKNHSQELFAIEQKTKIGPFLVNRFNARQMYCNQVVKQSIVIYFQVQFRIELWLQNQSWALVSSFASTHQIVTVSMTKQEKACPPLCKIDKSVEDIREISLNKYSRCSIIPNMVVQMVGAAGGSMEVGRTRGTSHVSQPYIYFQQVFSISSKSWDRAGGKVSRGGH